MALVCVAQPVPETRELLEHLLRRLGHEILPASEADRADALVFEAASPGSVALASRLALSRPHVALIACSPFPVDPAVLPAGTTSLTQPFAPSDLARALSGALAAAG